MAFTLDELKEREKENETFDKIRAKLVTLLSLYTVEAEHLHPDYLSKINTASAALLNLMTCSDMSMQIRIEMDRMKLVSIKDN